MPVEPAATIGAAGQERRAEAATDEVSIRLALDFRAGEARVAIGGEGAEVRIIERGGRWGFDRP